MKMAVSNSPWNPIATAPADVELELCVHDGEEYHASGVPLPAQRCGLVHVRLNKMVPIRPTHWRLWARERAVKLAWGPPMQQIADWLEKLGMSEYAQRFAENRVDFSVLPDLTDQDLEELGVLLGDRRKMPRAIANLDAALKRAHRPCPLRQDGAAFHNLRIRANLGCGATVDLPRG